MIWKLAALLLILLPSAAYAQPAEEDDEESALCIQGAVLIHWFPSHEETRAIETVPVPDSIRIRLEPGDCGPPFYSFAQLADWHLRFGSERSTTAALAYGERKLTAGLPAPANYLNALRTARRALEQSGNRQHPQRAKARARDWKRLAGATQIYLPAADEYLRAAEELRSLPLLDRAESYLAAIDAATPYLQSLGEAADDPDAARKEDLRLRIAVLRASVTLRAADIARADTLLAATGRPFYRELAERAYESGSELCDLGDSTPMITLAEQCEQVGAIETRLTSFWLNRAALDSIHGALDSGTTDVDRSYASTETAMRLADRAKEPDWDRCYACWLQNDPKREVVFRLRRLRTQAGAHRYTVLMEQEDKGPAWSKWVETLDELRTMERAAPPFEAPSRFRRLAESWLTLWRRTPGLRISDDRDRADRERYAAYLQATLAVLPQISTAQGASEPVPVAPN